MRKPSTVIIAALYLRDVENQTVFTARQLTDACYKAHKYNDEQIKSKVLAGESAAGIHSIPSEHLPQSYGYLTQIIKQQIDRGNLVYVNRSKRPFTYQLNPNNNKNV